MILSFNLKVKCTIIYIKSSINSFCDVVKYPLKFRLDPDYVGVMTHTISTALINFTS